MVKDYLKLKPVQNTDTIKHMQQSMIRIIKNNWIDRLSNHPQNILDTEKACEMLTSKPQL
jgi:hypothetical protein